MNDWAGMKYETANTQQLEGGSYQQPQSGYDDQEPRKRNSALSVIIPLVTLVLGIAIGGGVILRGYVKPLKEQAQALEEEVALVKSDYEALDADYEDLSADYKALGADYEKLTSRYLSKARQGANVSEVARDALVRLIAYQSLELYYQSIVPEDQWIDYEQLLEGTRQQLEEEDNLRQSDSSDTQPDESDSSDAPPDVPDTKP